MDPHFKCFCTAQFYYPSAFSHFLNHLEVRKPVYCWNNECPEPVHIITIIFLGVGPLKVIAIPEQQPSPTCWGLLHIVSWIRCANGFELNTTLPSESSAFSARTPAYLRPVAGWMSSDNFQITLRSAHFSDLAEKAVFQTLSLTISLSKVRYGRLPCYGVAQIERLW